MFVKKTVSKQASLFPMIESHSKTKWHGEEADRPAEKDLGRNLSSI
jgi:hypothetical protein